jgi:hypothetical protein
MLHKHHIIPKHIGGSDNPDNLIELTIEQHAEEHRLLFEKHGRWQDKLAWLGLAKLITDDEHKRLFYKECGKMGAAITNAKKTSIEGPKRKPGSFKGSTFYPKGVDGRKTRKKRFWYNNKIEHKQCSHENAPIGWVRGKLPWNRN